jgi:hypothetical protein
MLKEVRTLWKMTELYVPGFDILFAGQSDAPVWGAGHENFGELAVIEASLEGTN